MINLPEDVIEFLLKITETGGTFREEAERLLYKYVPAPKAEPFHGTKTETWAIPPELVRDR